MEKYLFETKGKLVMKEPEKFNYSVKNNGKEGFLLVKKSIMKNDITSLPLINES